MSCCLVTNGRCDLTTGADIFPNRDLFLSVVGVLCQEAVHEQKSVSSWTVNDSGPTVSILHLQDGWEVFFWMGCAFVSLR